MRRDEVLTAPPGAGLVTPIGHGITPVDLRDLAVASDRGGRHGVQVEELARTEIFSLVGAMVAATSRIRVGHRAEQQRAP
jgi:alkanesulfonate monooxygenase SsuD/methylene tetrahydromethanopterin reductase-like flavin-dependent oxidoreductase (luciferase family)